MTPILEIENLVFSFSSETSLLDQVSFQLPRGETLWVTGPAGSGKSTLLRLLIRELEPQSGSGRFLGRPLFGPEALDRRELRRDVGVICQDDRLLPLADVYCNVALPLTVKGYRKSRLAARVQPALKRVGLIGKARQAVETLSTTECRLVSLARVLAQNPPLIVADLTTGDLLQCDLPEHLCDAATFGAAVLLLAPERLGPEREYQLTGEKIVVKTV